MNEGDFHIESVSHRLAENVASLKGSSGHDTSGLQLIKTTVNEEFEYRNSKSENISGVIMPRTDAQNFRLFCKLPRLSFKNNLYNPHKNTPERNRLTNDKTKPPFS